LRICTAPAPDEVAVCNLASLCLPRFVSKEFDGGVQVCVFGERGGMRERNEGERAGENRLLRGESCEEKVIRCECGC